MPKKALCVGVNDYPYEGFDLNGCINDATAWSELLMQHYDFPKANVKLLFDDQATKKNIMEGLKNLLAGANSGDILVFTNSSHGSYIADTDGDEPMYDEVICPFDCADNLIVDDELRGLFADLPQGVSLTVISDSCFSGTVCRPIISDVIPGFRTPDDRRVRFLNPAMRGDKVLPNPWKARPKRFAKYPESRMKEILISGCTDREYSYDALISGIYHGAMTHTALQIIKDANYKITYNQLISRIAYLIEDAGFPQHPQLEGSDLNKKKQIFT